MSEITYSIGYNFDRNLANELDRINRSRGRIGDVREVFGATADSPYPSARPSTRLPEAGSSDLAWHVAALADVGIAFNYLLNAPVTSVDYDVVARYCGQLQAIGIRRLTAGTPEICIAIKRAIPEMHVTMSLTYGVRSPAMLERAVNAGADAVYLDAVYVNRNFSLLRDLIARSRAEVRLYANVSCVSRCPVVRQHYAIFVGQNEHTAERNDWFFAGCTALKLALPVEWMQMPWIRPEDINIYVREGIRHFKLADRLAGTSVLGRIARAYVTGRSPEDLFPIIERDGAKYQAYGFPPTKPPMRVWSKRIPEAFIEHFRANMCTSSDPDCPQCLAAAASSVECNSEARTLAPWGPAPLLRRIDRRGSGR